MKRVHVVILQISIFFSVATVLLYSLSSHEFITQNVARVQSVLKPAADDKFDSSHPATVYVTVTATPTSTQWTNTWPTATYPAAETGKSPKVFDAEKEGNIENTVRAILDPEDTSVGRLECPAMSNTSLARYDYLRFQDSADLQGRAEILPKYLFALDLYQCYDLLPRLLGSVIEAINFLGPENCVLSIIEGRSDDGTYETLNNPRLREGFADMGLRYHLGTNEVDPKGEGVDRIASLADLRNQALDPLLSAPEKFDPNTVVVFVNDVFLCPIDILELVHKKGQIKANQVCAMDWDDFDGIKFYDCWVSRQLSGEMLFEMPQNGNWEYSHNLFWDEPKVKARYNRRAPVQVFSCWNGITVFDALPFTQLGVRFRTNRQGECKLGEPVHMDKDFWARGYGKIAIVPSVNVAYTEENMVKVREEVGTVEDEYEKEYTGAEEGVQWVEEPPRIIKCYNPDSWSSEWRAWDEGLYGGKGTGGGGVLRVM